MNSKGAWKDFTSSNDCRSVVTKSLFMVRMQKNKNAFVERKRKRKKKKEGKKKKIRVEKDILVLIHSKKKWMGLNEKDVSLMGEINQFLDEWDE